MDSPPATPPSPEASLSPTTAAYRADESVRDLHRSLVGDRAKVPASISVNELKLPVQFRLQPDVGCASDLAQPGGFRRAHLDVKSDNIIPSNAYRATSLLATLHQTGFTRSFVTRAVQRLEDGTELEFGSRGYRRGAQPILLHSPHDVPWYSHGLDELRIIGFKPLAVPYWVSVSFLVGAILFVYGSFAWFAMGDTPVTPFDMHVQVTYPFWVGSVLFLVGCYLGFVEVINANLEEDVKSGKLNIEGRFAGKESLKRHTDENPSFLESASEPLVTAEGAATSSVSSRLSSKSSPPSSAPADSLLGCLRQLHWFRLQPGSLLWWGALIQLIGAILFEVACTAGLPGIAESYELDEDWWINGPQLVGSACFVFASYVYLLEVAPLQGSSWTQPASLRDFLGYGVTLCNLAGSFLFLVASVFYFVHRWPRVVPQEEWEFLASEWGVRFGFGVGSAFFVAGALFSLPEVLNDD